ncbi:MAG TPA: hypothetical protein VMS74_15710 [Acidimicrobiia bacterium]|nr:hypothetical protein [Acidimicrobiia bacterium]
MLIDCDRCSMRDTTACDDCVVGVLIAIGPGPLELDDDEREALDALSDAGLVPRLRLVERPDPPAAAAG